MKVECRRLLRHPSFSFIGRLNPSVSCGIGRRGPYFRSVTWFLYNFACDVFLRFLDYLAITLKHGPLILSANLLCLNSKQKQTATSNSRHAPCGTRSVWKVRVIMHCGQTVSDVTERQPSCSLYIACQKSHWKDGIFPEWCSSCTGKILLKRQIFILKVLLP